MYDSVQTSLDNLDRSNSELTRAIMGSSRAGQGNFYPGYERFYTKVAEIGPFMDSYEFSR